MYQPNRRSEDFFGRIGPDDLDPIEKVVRKANEEADMADGWVRFKAAGESNYTPWMPSTPNVRQDWKEAVKEKKQQRYEDDIDRQKRLNMYDYLDKRQRNSFNRDNRWDITWSQAKERQRAAKDRFCRAYRRSRESSPEQDRHRDQENNRYYYRGPVRFAKRSESPEQRQGFPNAPRRGSSPNQNRDRYQAREDGYSRQRDRSHYWNRGDATSGNRFGANRSPSPRQRSSPNQDRRSGSPARDSYRNEKYDNELDDYCRRREAGLNRLGANRRSGSPNGQQSNRNDPEDRSKQHSFGANRNQQNRFESSNSQRGNRNSFGASNGNRSGQNANQNRRSDAGATYMALREQHRQKVATTYPGALSNAGDRYQARENNCYVQHDRSNRSPSPPRSGSSACDPNFRANDSYGYQNPEDDYIRQHGYNRRNPASSGKRFGANRPKPVSRSTSPKINRFPESPAYPKPVSTARDHDYKLDDYCRRREAGKRFEANRPRQVSRSPPPNANRRFGSPNSQISDRYQFGASSASKGKANQARHLSTTWGNRNWNNSRSHNQNQHFKKPFPVVNKGAWLKCRDCLAAGALNKTMSVRAVKDQIHHNVYEVKGQGKEPRKFYVFGAVKRCGEEDLNPCANWDMKIWKDVDDMLTNGLAPLTLKDKNIKEEPLKVPQQPSSGSIKQESETPILNNPLHASLRGDRFGGMETEVFPGRVYQGSWKDRDFSPETQKKAEPKGQGSQESSQGSFKVLGDSSFLPSGPDTPASRRHQQMYYNVLKLSLSPPVQKQEEPKEPQYLSKSVAKPLPVSSKSSESSGSSSSSSSSSSNSDSDSDSENYVKKLAIKEEIKELKNKVNLRRLDLEARHSKWAKDEIGYNKALQDAIDQKSEGSQSSSGWSDPLTPAQQQFLNFTHDRKPTHENKVKAMSFIIKELGDDADLFLNGTNKKDIGKIARKFIDKIKNIKPEDSMKHSMSAEVLELLQSRLHDLERKINIKIPESQNSASLPEASRVSEASGDHQEAPIQAKKAQEATAGIKKHVLVTEVDEQLHILKHKRIVDSQRRRLWQKGDKTLSKEERDKRSDKMISVFAACIENRTPITDYAYLAQFRELCRCFDLFKFEEVMDETQFFDKLVDDMIYENVKGWITDCELQKNHTEMIKRILDFMRKIIIQSSTHNEKQCDALAVGFIVSRVHLYFPASLRRTLEDVKLSF